MEMSKALRMASLPAAAGLAWHQHRKALRVVDSYPTSAPDLPGVRRHVSTDWGNIGYRYAKGDPGKAPLVFIHGWSRTSDSTWWPVLPDCDRTMAAVDLPGHGDSHLDRPFTFELAAEAVLCVIEKAGLKHPVLVSHSMGGPVSLSAIRNGGAQMFGGLIALATSAYWVRPRLRVMMAMAPYAMAPRSPLVVHKSHYDYRRAPDEAPLLSWANNRRPARKTLHEAAIALRRFDARRWHDLSLPPTIWGVATRDRVLAPTHQYASAELVGAHVVEVETNHSMVSEAPEDVLALIDRSLGVFPARASSIGTPEYSDAV